MNKINNDVLDSKLISDDLAEIIKTYKSEHMTNEFVSGVPIIKIDHAETVEVTIPPNTPPFSLKASNCNEVIVNVNAGKELSLPVIPVKPKEVMELFPHQQELLEAVRDYVGGRKEKLKRIQAICGTGYGKTHLIPHIFNLLFKEFGYRTFGFGLPWINLADESVNKMLEIFEKLGVLNDFRVVLTHSGAVNDYMIKRFGDNVLKSDNIQDIDNFHQKAINEGKSIIYAVLYKSGSKLGNILNELNITLDFILFDEAHNNSRSIDGLELVAQLEDKDKIARVKEINKDVSELKIETKKFNSENKTEHDKKIESKISELLSERYSIYRDEILIPNTTIIPFKQGMFVTATPTSKAVRGERSMENDNVFGRNVYECPTSWLSNNGFFISPTCRILESTLEKDDIDEDLDSNMMNTIGCMVRCVNLCETNYFTDEPIKMLVYVFSVKNIEGLIGKTLSKKRIDDPEYTNEMVKSNKKFRKLMKKYTSRNYTILGISADMKTNEVNKVMNDFKNCKKDAILINCKKLNEGVDIHGVNAQLMLRNDNDINMAQINGRGGRLHPLDISDIFNGKLTENGEYNGYRKQKSMLFLADVKQTEQTMERMRSAQRILDLLKNASFIEGDATNDLVFHTSGSKEDLTNRLADVMIDLSAGSEMRKVINGIIEKEMLTAEEIEIDDELDNERDEDLF